MAADDALRTGTATAEQLSQLEQRVAALENTYLPDAGGITNNYTVNQAGEVEPINEVREGEGKPAEALGANGEFYIDTSTNVWYRKIAGKWVVVNTPGLASAQTAEVVGPIDWVSGAGRFAIYKHTPASLHSETLLIAVGDGKLFSETLLEKAFYGAVSGATQEMEAVISVNSAGLGTLRIWRLPTSNPLRPTPHMLQVQRSEAVAAALKLRLYIVQLSTGNAYASNSQLVAAYTAGTKFGVRVVSKVGAHMTLAGMLSDQQAVSASDSALFSNLAITKPGGAGGFAHAQIRFFTATQFKTWMLANGLETNEPIYWTLAAEAGEKARGAIIDGGGTTNTQVLLE